jgi:hypothetical protein
MRTVAAALGVALVLGLTAGCDDSPKSTAKPAVAPRETVGKTTQEVKRLQDALAEGAVVAEGGGAVGPSGGYLGTLAKAYRSSVATAAMARVQQDLLAYDLQNNGPIKNYDEFMQFIIKKGQPDGLALPMLPYYQEYAYDEANRQLVVVEYPERKTQVDQQK